MLHPEQDTHTPAPTIIKVFVSASPEDVHDGMVTELLARVARDLEPDRDSGAASSSQEQTRIEFIGGHEVAGSGPRDGVPAETDILLAIISPAYFADAACRAQWEQFRAIEASRRCDGEAIVPVAIVDSRLIVASDAAWWSDLRTRGCVELCVLWPRGKAGFDAEDCSGRVPVISSQVIVRNLIAQACTRGEADGIDDSMEVSKFADALTSLSFLIGCENRAEQSKVRSKYMERAVALRERLAATSTASPDCRLDLAKALGDLAGSYRDEGEHAEAQAAYSRAIQLCEAVAAASPTHAVQAQRRVASLMNRLGHLLQKTEQSRSRECYRQSMLVLADLGERCPELDGVAEDCFHSCISVGDLARAEEDHQLAVACFTAAAAIAEKLPPHRLALALERIASAHRRAGRPRDAMPYAERAVAIALNQFQHRSDLPSSAVAVAIAIHRVAGLLVAVGELDASNAQYHRAFETLEKCRQTHPDDLWTLRFLALNRMGLSDVFRDIGDLPRASSLIREAVGFSEQAFTLDHRGIGLHARVLQAQADLDAAAGQLEEARRHLVRAVAACEDAARKEPDEPHFAELVATWQGVLREFDAKNPGPGTA